MQDQKINIQPPHLNMELIDIPGEIWKDIPGLEEYGMISNFGRVKRLEDHRIMSDGRTVHIEERIMKQKISTHFNEFKNDYKQRRFSRIQIERFTHSISVGRIVFYCFVEKFDLVNHLLYVTYKDGNGLNVVPENLILTDHKGLQQMIIAKKRKDMHFGHSEENQKLYGELGYHCNIKRVSRYNMEGIYMNTFESISIAAKTFNLSISSISSAASGKNGALTAGGFIWRFGASKKTIAVKKIHKAIRATRGEPVSQYDLEGNKINTYFNINQAGQAIGKYRKTVSDAVNGRILILEGSIWRKGEAEKIDVKREQISLSLRKGYTISQYDLSGKKIATYTSSKNATQATGIPSENINAMAIRDDLLLKGHIWRYGETESLSLEELARIKENLELPKVKYLTQYDLKGMRIAWFGSVAEASTAIGVPQATIRHCLNGYRATGGRFIWRSGKGKSKLILPETPRPLGHKLTKAISQFDLNGNLIASFQKISEASRATGIAGVNISSVLRGDSHTAGGYIWKQSSS